MQKGIIDGLFESLPKCETEDFLKKDQIKGKGAEQPDVEASNQNVAQKLNYAKQKALLRGLNSKLDYFNLQKERHPYIKELREFAIAQKNESKDKQITLKQH